MVRYVMMGIKVVFPAARPMDRRPQPPRNHQAPATGSAVGDYDRRRLGEFPSATSAASSPAFALTPSSGHIPPELGRHALTAMVPPLGSAAVGWVHHPFVATA